MENLDTEIILGKGFEDIKLGMTEFEVMQILNTPDTIDEFDHDNDGGDAKTFYYSDMGVELTFESEDDYVLSYISVSNDQFHIKEKIHNGMLKAEVMNAIPELGLGEFTDEIVDTETDEEGKEELVSFEEENLNLWFVNDVLDEIEIGPFWEDDDTPIWPE